MAPADRSLIMVPACYRTSKKNRLVIVFNGLLPMRPTYFTGNRRRSEAGHRVVFDLSASYDDGSRDLSVVYSQA